MGSSATRQSDSAGGLNGLRMSKTLAREEDDGAFWVIFDDLLEPTRLPGYQATRLPGYQATRRQNLTIHQELHGNDLMILSYHGVSRASC